MKCLGNSAAVALLLIAAGSNARAQTVTFEPRYVGQQVPQCDFAPTGSSAPVMFACVDWVNPNAGIVAGWAMDWKTGHMPQSVQLWRIDAGHEQKLADVSISVARPDVASYFGLSDQSLGFGLIAPGPLAPGRYAVLTTDMPYSWTCGYDLDRTFWCAYAASLMNFSVR